MAEFFGGELRTEDVEHAKRIEVSANLVADGYSPLLMLFLLHMTATAALTCCLIRKYIRSTFNSHRNFLTKKKIDVV